MNKKIIIFFILLLWLSAAVVFAEEPALPIVLKIENKEELLQRKIKIGDEFVLNIEVNIRQEDAREYLGAKYAVELWLSGGLNLLNTDFKLHKREGTNSIYRISGVIDNKFINKGSKKQHTIRLTASQQEKIFVMGLLPEIRSKKYISGYGIGETLYLIFEDGQEGRFAEQVPL